MGSVESALVDVTVPTGLTMSEVSVDVGDFVEVGTPIATVDTASVSAAITTTNDELDAIEDSLYYLEYGTTITTYVQSYNYATVKTIYASVGDNAADVMAANGALMILELADGGELSIKNSAGTISELSVYEGCVVYSGSYLFALTAPQVTETAEELEAQRTEKLAELELLSTLFYEPVFYANAAGTVSEVWLRAGEPFTASDGVALRLVSHDQVQLTITVDELDIGSVEVGQEVSVEVEALGSEGYAGTVTEVPADATVSNGSASFTATVTFNKPEGCLVGMSATATIIKERKDDVLTIPLAAVQEYGDSVYVYTSVDEMGTLGGEVAIETGLSDGTSVEVVSGLSEGTVLSYRQESTSSLQPQFSVAGGFPMGGDGGNISSGTIPGGVPTGGGR
jgi:multidrug efflux pump subunit AcrA (membrane-fusion protein)